MQGESNEKFRRKSGRDLKRRIVVLSAAIMAAICALVTEVVVREREAALELARGEAANLAASFEEQIRGTLNGLAGAMELLKERIEAEGPAFDLDRWKTKVPELLGPAARILILDAAGKVRGTGGGNEQADLSGRDYFAALRDNPNAGLFIGKPVMGKFTQGLIIPVAKRLSARDGRFDGVLVLAVDPQRLSNLHRKIRLGRTGSMALFREDGVALARFTGEEGLDRASIGARDPEIDGRMAGSRETFGEYRAKGSSDSITRLYSWRRVPGYPLYVVAGIGENEALAATIFRSSIIVCLGLAALCLPLITMFMLNKEISARVDHAVALDRQGEKVHVEHAALLAITEELAKERIKLRRSNKELALARRRAEEANQAKSVFLANMSHELRTPLNAVLGFSEIIRDKMFGNDVARYAEYAADIHRSGAHLLAIVNDILDVTRIEAGRFELREERVKLAAVVEASLLAVERQAAKGCVSLTRNLPEAGAIVHCDETKLNQVIINLLSNAIKFTPSGGRVELSAAADRDGSLLLTVRDNGIGMARHEIRDAVQLFHQVDSSLSRRYEGTGLGLPLAIQLTELHGGTLTVDSAPGEGTKVTVRLPADRVEWEASVVPMQKPVPAAPLKYAS
jgi:two-component system, cell cycle sensor histidine kinase PleC